MGGSRVYQNTVQEGRAREVVEACVIREVPKPICQSLSNQGEAFGQVNKNQQ